MGRSIKIRKLMIFPWQNKSLQGRSKPMCLNKPPKHPPICSPKACPLQHTKHFSVTGPVNAVENPVTMTAINSILQRSKKLVPIQ